MSIWPNKKNENDIISYEWGKVSAYIPTCFDLSKFNNGPYRYYLGDSDALCVLTKDKKILYHTKDYKLSKQIEDKLDAILNLATDCDLVVSFIGEPHVIYNITKIKIYCTVSPTPKKNYVETNPVVFDKHGNIIRTSVGKVQGIFIRDQAAAFIKTNDLTFHDNAKFVATLVDEYFDLRTLDYNLRDVPAVIFPKLYSELDDPVISAEFSGLLRVYKKKNSKAIIIPPKEGFDDFPPKENSKEDKKEEPSDFYDPISLRPYLSKVIEQGVPSVISETECIIDISPDGILKKLTRATIATDHYLVLTLSIKGAEYNKEEISTALGFDNFRVILNG